MIPKTGPLRLSDANSSAIGLLRVLLAASVILFAAATWFGYRATLTEAGRDLDRTAEVAAEHAEKIFDSQVQLEDRVRELIAGLDEEQIRARERPLHDRMNALIARLPHAASVMVAAKDGHPLVSAGTYPVPRNVDLHGRDYFDTVIGSDKDTSISKLQVGEVYKQPFFGLARPWTDADGRLLGVIDLAASPAFFLDLYDVLLGEGGGDPRGKVVTLVRNDGQVILRDPPVPGDQPRTPVGSAFQAAIHTAPLRGWYEATSMTDPGAPARLFAYRQIRGYPLYVLAGRTESTILAPWRRNTAWRAALGACATLVLLGVTWTALTRTRREAWALELAPDLPPVSVDPGQFEAAILNLVGNARDAMPDGGSVTIGTGYHDTNRSRVRVTVTETGAGMDRDTASRAFEPFFTTKGVGKGTGLGLSQVYGFVRQAGGDVRIASAPGAGTTIEIVLPASAAEPLVESPEQAAAEPAGGAKVVLVVEDEPNVLEVAVDTLRDLGYVTVAEPDAHAALRRLAVAERFDVLFTDMVMPGGLNGLQLSREARRLRPDIKVLLTSGYTGIADGDLPADIPLLPKPYNRDQLSACLASTLAR